MSFQDVGRSGKSKRLTHDFNNAGTNQGPSTGSLSAAVGGGHGSQLLTTADANYAELSNSILQYQVQYQLIYIRSFRPNILVPHSLTLSRKMSVFSKPFLEMSAPQPMEPYLKHSTL